MTSSDIIFIILAVFFAVVIVWSVVGTVLNRKRLGRETSAIGVVRNMKYVKTSLTCAAISAVLCGLLVISDCDEIHDIKSGQRDSVYYACSDPTETIEEYRSSLLVKPTRHRKWFALMFIGWTATALLRAEEYKNRKKVCVTERGVYLSDSFRPAEKIRYELDGNKLKLYYGKSNTPAEYTITEEKERLISTLADNYKPYQ